MLSQAFTVRMAWLPMLGLSLVVILSIVANSAESRVRLDADVLARSRGGNQANVLVQNSCDAAAGIPPCLFVGQLCTTCALHSFTDTFNNGGTSGGYDPGAPLGGWCGAIFNGVCNVQGLCAKNGAGAGNCVPPGSPTVQ